eukprot:3615553-Rhodomonas_salina.2
MLRIHNAIRGAEVSRMLLPGPSLRWYSFRYATFVSPSTLPLSAYTLPTRCPILTWRTAPDTDLLPTRSLRNVRN